MDQYFFEKNNEWRNFFLPFFDLQKAFNHDLIIIVFPDAPKTDPTIDTEKERIAVGELLRANCTTGNSRPASAITWKLNKDLVSILSLSLSRVLSSTSSYVTLLDD